jgi:VWFA-related protein
MLSRSVAALLVAAALAPAAAQQPPNAPPIQPRTTPTTPIGQPVFRSGVDLVTVDVTVIDGHGRPVEHLGPPDFTLRVDGSPRRLVWAEYVAHGAQSRRPPSPPLSPPISPPVHFSSNAHVEPGRVVIIAVDQMHIRRVEGRGALKAAAQFIETLDPSDRVAAAPLTHTGPIQFTDDHASVKRYLERLVGEGYTMPTGFNIGLAEALAVSDGSRARLDQVVLRECGEPLARVDSLARATEREGLRDPCPTQIEQEARMIAQHARTQATLSIDALGRLIARLAEIEGPKALVLLSEGLVAEPQLVDLTALGAAAQAARVTIYVLQLETPVFEAADSTVSPTLDADQRVRSDGLARLAGSARGALFRLVGSDPFPFQRIARELSGYYLLGFEGAAEDRDGRAHRVEVSSWRSNVTIRARPTFRIDAASGAAALGDRLVRLLRTPRLATEIPLQVATYAFEEARGGRIKVVVSAESEAGADSREITLGFVLVDGRDRVVTSATHVTGSGAYSFPVTVEPGGYRLKAAAIDAAGRGGSVERRVEARLGGTAVLRMSDLMLAAPPADPSEPPRPLVDATSLDRVVAYLELYAGRNQRPTVTGVTMEIARDKASAALASVPAVLARSGADRLVARAELELRDLLPGAYLARAIINVQGAAPAHAVRPFTIRR